MNAPFEEFYTTYRPYVARIIHLVARGISPEQAEDLVQETFLRAWQFYSRLEPYAVKAWIARVARNTAIDSLRSQRRRQKYICGWNEEAALRLPDKDTTAQMVYDGGADLIVQALASLGRQDQIALRMLGQGYTYTEIAASLGVNYDSCKQHIMRARRRFRNQYLALCG